jgi:nitroreductase
MLDCLVPFNISWAQAAPVLGLVIAQKNFKHNGKPNAFGEYDSGQATATLVLQATALDLVAHQMGGFDKTKAVETFELGEELIPLVVVAIGKQGSIDQLDDEMSVRESAPRVRKELSDIVLRGLPN